MVNEERLVRTFLELLQQESPSLGEFSMGKWLSSHLSQRGFKVTMDDAGNRIGGNCGNIVAYLAGVPDREPICFSAHLDQIQPCRGIKPVIDGDLIRTDGTTTLGGDDKAGVAAIIETVEHILEENQEHPDLYLLFTVCEEQGLQGSKNFDTGMLPARNMVIIDAAGPAGILAYKAPAMRRIEMKFFGKKAHAGIEPEKGINAIMVAAQSIALMNTGRIDFETTVNLGKIEGGLATNIVPDEVTVIAEVRSHSMKKLEDQMDHMMQCCERISEQYRSRYRVMSDISYPAFELSKDSTIYQTCLQAFQRAGIEPQPIITGGGSDANILSSKGYQCAIISVGMDQVHTVDETINIRDMYATTVALTHMLRVD